MSTARLARPFMPIVLALSFSLLLAMPARTHAQTNDHLKCYQVKDVLNLAAVVDLDSPQFGVEPGCKVSKAKFFCVPATKTVISAENKTTKSPITPLPISGPDAGDRICYKLKCPVNPPPPPADQDATDQFGHRTLAKFKASYLCTPAVKGAGYCGDGLLGAGEQCDGAFLPAGCSGGCLADCRCHYKYNGDETVTDNTTGLQWEQKGSPDGIPLFANPHDVDNQYTWSASGSAGDGQIVTEFLWRLNNCTSSDGSTVTGGFAGHCDWRLPSSAELQTILLAPYPCGTSPCIDPIFGATAASFYWSATTYAGNPFLAWFVYFDDGNVFHGNKNFTNYVRAVRTGS